MQRSYYINNEKLANLNDIINQIFNNEVDYELFYEKHFLETPIKVLASNYNVTEANIKYNLGKSKKSLQEKITKLRSEI